MKVLSGEKSKMTIQVGTNDNEVIEFNLDKIDNDTLGVASDNLFDAKTEKKGVKETGAAIDAKDIGVSGGTSYLSGISVKEYKVDGKVSADKVVLKEGSDEYVVSKIRLYIKIRYYYW
ncbi:flagellin 2 [Proteus mirabilis]|uniref:Flagellin 2 n=1 Tax=Proteus mirabilis TaxID=584 RepID=A0A379GGL8_PROMI|nr:flagellin 2 [Proteus mirabilis]